LLCLGAGVSQSIWFSLSAQNYTYLAYTDFDEGFVTVFIVSTGKWFLIMMNFVPISLMVILELIKFWQAIFFAWDVTMYDE